MSAAKMVADSTQSDTDSRKKRNGSRRREKRSRSRRDRRRRRHSSSSSRGSSDSRRSRSGSDSRSDDYDSDIDLQKELKPLGAYLRKPGELLDQMLHSVRGSSLQRALPDVLKDMPMDELRRRCLEHLEVMSRKRMKRILGGDDPGAISSSGTEDDESTDEEKEAGDKENKADSTEEGKEGNGDGSKVEGEEKADSPLSLAADDIEDNVLGATPRHTDPSREEEEAMEDEGGGGEELAGRDEEEEEEEDEDWEMEGGGAGEDMADVLFPEVEQDKMELLELEMRARAIKAMLALHEQREKDQKSRMKKK